jgi:hypothetical protein
MWNQGSFLRALQDVSLVGRGPKTGVNAVLACVGAQGKSYLQDSQILL